jgi:hypothetical protein
MWVDFKNQSHPLQRLRENFESIDDYEVKVLTFEAFTLKSSSRLLRGKNAEFNVDFDIQNSVTCKKLLQNN